MSTSLEPKHAAQNDSLTADFTTARASQIPYVYAVPKQTSSPHHNHPPITLQPSLNHNSTSLLAGPTDSNFDPARRFSLPANFPLSAPTRQERRREQNRLSQRAFRDRQNAELELLQIRIPQLEAQQQRLSESLFAQAGELGRLRSQVGDLTKRIETLVNEVLDLQVERMAQLPFVPWGQSEFLDG